MAQNQCMLDLIKKVLNYYYKKQELNIKAFIL